MKVNGLGFRNSTIVRKSPILKNSTKPNNIGLQSRYSGLDALANYNSLRFTSDWDDDLFNTGHDLVWNDENYYKHEEVWSELTPDQRFVQDMEKKYKDVMFFAKSFMIRMKMMKSWAKHKAKKVFPADYSSGKTVDVTQIVHSNAKYPIIDVFISLDDFLVKRENGNHTFDIFSGDKYELKKVVIGRSSYSDENYDAIDEYVMNEGKLRLYSSGVKVRDGIRKVDELIVVSYNPNWIGECYKNLVIMPDGTKYFDKRMEFLDEPFHPIKVNESNPCPEEILEKFNTPPKNE